MIKNKKGPLNRGPFFIRILNYFFLLNEVAELPQELRERSNFIKSSNGARRKLKLNSFTSFRVVDSFIMKVNLLFHLRLIVGMRNFIPY